MNGAVDEKNTFSPAHHPHLRYNHLLGTSVLVCSHRLKRPWQGQTEKVFSEDQLEWDPNNPLCPGVKRASGAVTPNYTSTYVFDNDFPALLKDSPSPPESTDPLFVASPARGVCRVVCFHPKSNVTIPLMSQVEVEAVVDTWVEQFRELSEKYLWVQLFENRGLMMGCSNQHPHCQVWASDFLPSEPMVKDQKQKEYYQKYNIPLLVDYVQKEVKLRERLVAVNQTWVCLVPYWAAWPYETMLIPRRHVPKMQDLLQEEKRDLADIMRVLTSKYDNLFSCSFPYTMGFHGAHDSPSPPESTDPLFVASPARGVCRVVCFHPKSNVTIPLMSQVEVEAVVDTWVEQFRELSEKYLWVQLFENRGLMMGCSNQHPHCQVWASDFLPSEPMVKDQKQKEYYQKYNIPLLVDYVQKEVKLRERLVAVNQTWVCLVPYWAAWPYETMLIPRRHVPKMQDLLQEEKRDLADIMRVLTSKYDNLFSCSFPYTMGFHGAPGADFEGGDEYWQLHGMYYPCLLSSSTVRKFMGGYETFAQVLRERTPEEAALHLRNTSSIHYRIEKQPKMLLSIRSAFG
ncbi:unnamed protein product [Cyprideis torosa]|uniref:Galactose-1-phosphate uridylyltransferase n=1 Tax=Cyprideis torosa TaxID=163714 RepID=A0A7R8WKM8_9CRUS|nr:unnamed protein product [Cyprideis torosa]CAG0903378.1 unnamed protein product [Cyprideis torosa]